MQNQWNIEGKNIAVENIMLRWGEHEEGRSDGMRRGIAGTMKEHWSVTKRKEVVLVRAVCCCTMVKKLWSCSTRSLLFSFATSWCFVFFLAPSFSFQLPRSSTVYHNNSSLSLLKQEYTLSQRMEKKKSQRRDEELDK